MDAHGEAEAQRLVVEALAELGAPGDTVALTGRGRWKEEKEMVAALVRKHTELANRRVAARLGMGHEVSVTRAVGASGRTRTQPAGSKHLNASWGSAELRAWVTDNPH